MVRRFKSDAGQMRAAYLSSLLVALYEAVRASVRSLRQAAAREMPAPVAPRLRHGSPSTWGGL